MGGGLLGSKFIVDAYWMFIVPCKSVCNPMFVPDLGLQDRVRVRSNAADPDPAPGWVQ